MTAWCWNFRFENAGFPPTDLMDIALFLLVLSVAGPVFLVVGTGYGAARIKLAPAPMIDALLSFSTNLAIPCLLFLATYRLDLGAAFDLRMTGSFYGAGLVCFVIGIVMARTAFRKRPGEAIATGFCALFSNTVLLGIPVVTRAFGDGALDRMMSIVAVHSPICYLVGIVTMELARRDGAGPFETARRAVRSIFKNVIIAALGAGFALNFAGVILPETLLEALAMLAAAGLPTALFGLGGSLARYRIGTSVGEGLMVSALSLVAMPALCWVIAEQVFGLDATGRNIAVMMAATPVGLNGYVFAVYYKRGVDMAANTVLLSTVFSVLTIPVWLAVITSLG